MTDLATTPSPRAICTLVLGILALIPCCFVLTGPAAILLGRWELQAIAVGHAPTQGTPLARVGKILGLVGTCLWSLFLLGWLFLIGIGFLVQGL